MMGRRGERDFSARNTPEPGTDVTHPARVVTPAEAPLRVLYAEQSDRAYLVRELDRGRWVRVPKQRSAIEPYPATDGQRVPGARLIRWSVYALVGAVLGGVGGVVLGLVVALIAVLLLMRFSGRVRRWRREQYRQGGDSPLPAAASAERQRLRAAFWQGMLAATFGMALLVLLSGRLP